MKGINMGTKNVDKRLAESLYFLCNKEGFSPKDLTKLDNKNLFPNGYADMENMREAIEYLKNYAKLKAISKLLVDDESLKKDIQNTKKGLEKRIIETKNEITNLPKAPAKRRSKTLLYTYGDQYEKIENERVANARKKRAETLLSLRERIKSYKSKIKELDKLEKILNNPEKVMERFFFDEEKGLKSNYEALINICAKAINKNESFIFEDRSEEDKSKDVFTLEENGNYKLNYKNARKFLKTIKSKKAILKVADYAAIAEEHRKLDEQYKLEELKHRDYSDVEKIFDSKEFSDINDRMNCIFDDARKLSYMEYKQKNGMFSRIKKKICGFFGFTSKREETSNKIMKKRRELSRDIYAFLEYIDKNGYNSQYELYNKAFSRYMGTPQLGLKGIASNIEYSGASVIILPKNEITTETLKKVAIEAMKADTTVLQNLKKKVEETRVKKEEMYESFEDKVKEFIKENGTANILKYAKQYYSYSQSDKENDIMNIKLTEVTPSAAAIILESIMKRKNLSLDDTFDVYGQILNKDEENKSLEEIISQKLDFIHQYIGNMREEEVEK